MLLVLLGATAGGCAGGDADRGRILVLAASSLSEAFTELAELAAADGIDVDLSFGGSHVLVEQVRQGAPADLVAVADPAFIADFPAPVVFAHNQIVVVTPPGSTIDDVEDLAGPGVRVVLAAASAPIGRYTREALRDRGLLDVVMDNVVSEEPDDQSVVAKVALGEADAAIVYGTDARANARLRVAGDPLGVETSYAAALVDAAGAPDAARSFLRLLSSERGQRVLSRLGFAPA